MPDMNETAEPFDVFVIGGGVNGCGIARDAAGRGLRVALAEKDDLGSATSSASTKLFHGGLRYLEYFEVSLVAKALKEREVLLRAMPHISWPMRFVLPVHPDMRFESDTPTSRLLRIVMPWMKGRRPAWLIRLGLFLYDSMGGRQILPPTATLDLRKAPEGVPLDDRFRRAFEYSDCWVEDSRLVVLNARDAQDRGARIMTRTEVVSARRVEDVWRVELRDHITGAHRIIHARTLVNASGPWTNAVIETALPIVGTGRVRLVRGSHIVTRRLYDHEKAYFLQGTDGRIIFLIPYEQDFTLIGTTDMDHPSPDVPAECTDTEARYLCDFASSYLTRPVTMDDIVWRYSGVRPLYDDGATSAAAATRDYVLTLDAEEGAPVLSVFGGKITTYRKLAEDVMDRIASQLPAHGGNWTAEAPLAGGDFAVSAVPELIAQLRERHPFLDARWATRLIRAYGTEAAQMLDGAREAADLGRDFGATLTEREIRWQMAHEFAQRAEDVVWRRTRLGLRMTGGQIAALDRWMIAERRAEEGEDQP